MKRTGILKTLLITSIVFISCAGSNSTTQNASSSENRTSTAMPTDAVGQVGGEYITYTELKENYLSGSIEKEYSLEELQEFLPIYLEYKAKILQAEELGYYEKKSIIQELELYSKQAAYAYWLDKEIRPTKFEEFKAKYSYELKSSHVLIALAGDASPADTLAAYDLIMKAREEFLSGTPMSELDTEYSSKRDGRSMGGDLPWVSTGGLVAPFENALYALEVGEISMPVRTQFGYHIIHLEDKRERVLQRDLNHIFVRRGPNQSQIDSAYQRLLQKEDWDVVVREFSEDRASVSTRGNIGWVDYTSRYDPSFVETVMTLDPSVPFSSPIETTYGFHIFNIDSVQTFESEEAKDEFIRAKMNDANIVRENNSFVVDYIKSLHQSLIYFPAYDDVTEYITSSDTVNYLDLELPTDLASTNIFNFTGEDFTAQQFVNYLAETRGEQLNYNFRATLSDQFHEYIIDSKLTDLTLSRFPEFEEQINSYKHGIVVYQINEDSVWSSSTIDSTFLMKRYENDIDDYQFGERHFYYMITSRQDTSLNNAKEFIMAGNSPDSLISKGYNVGVNSDSTGIYQGEPFTLLEGMEPGTFSEIFEYGQRNGIFYLIENLPARIMTFDEAYNRLVSNYIPEREQNWLQNLRTNYGVKSYPDSLEQAFNNE